MLDWEGKSGLLYIDILFGQGMYGIAIYDKLT